MLILNDMDKNESENGDNDDKNEKKEEENNNKNKNRNRILLLSDDPRILLREECNQFVRSRKETSKDYNRTKCILY